MAGLCPGGGKHLNNILYIRIKNGKVDNMAKLKLFKGKEFKVYVTDNIQEDDLFFYEYRKAAEI